MKLMFFGTRDKIELKVAGMTCGHCEAKVEQALRQRPGIKKVSASRSREKVTIETDKSGLVDWLEVKETIEALGYQVLK